MLALWKAVLSGLLLFGAVPSEAAPNAVVERLLASVDSTEVYSRDALSTASSHGAMTKKATTYWLSATTHGKMPFADSRYQVFRNVRDFGAKGDGITDDTAAINRAISALSSTIASAGRCGQGCQSTSTLGAIVYFPAGTYMISAPLIQFYFTQFIGDPTSKPTIKGMASFGGVALIETDPYLPGGSQYYVNTNQFFRQVRNFVIDMTAMPRQNKDGNGGKHVPTGIHWQVAQATSLQNIDFKMPLSDASGAATAVGIYAENGSGGFMSDLTFYGGNYGMQVGAQQFTVRNVKFTSCLKAISLTWGWGWTWKNVEVYSCYVAFECGDGLSSMVVQDSRFTNVPYGITVKSGTTPNILLDNLRVGNTTGAVNVVQIDGGAAILSGAQSGSKVVTSWALGREVKSLNGLVVTQTGDLSPLPSKPQSLLAVDGSYFVRLKPQYETIQATDMFVVTNYGVKGDGTGNQAPAINAVFSRAQGRVVFFPAGVYRVESTVNVPLGSRIVGEAWPQIIAAGTAFQNASKPMVLMKIGVPGDRGVIEISDMLFTVSGPTAGAILMEWNVHESSQGSAGMWDSHFRVGGSVGSQLQATNCPKLTGTVNPKCIAAALMLHLTSKSSGYFENVWAWVADHDMDVNDQTQIDVYGGRGILIESTGPSWFYGTASEHSALYQYQLVNAANIYMGLIQTEAPYYQPTPKASQTVKMATFINDPTFSTCASNSLTCNMAWALRIVSSSNVFIYAAGFYSFFSNYSQSCLNTESCQDRLFETSRSQGIWVYSLFTKGAQEVASPQGLPATKQKDTQNGFTTALAAWLQLAVSGSNFGTRLVKRLAGL